MITTLFSCTLNGLLPSLVQVEVDLSNGLPGCQIVGLPDSIVQEARDRIRSAIKNSGFDFPARKITINLAPADQKKEGSGFDLCMALGILAASGQILAGSCQDFLILGELGLNGSVRSVPGILAMAQICKSKGVEKLILPGQNIEEAAVFPFVQAWPVGSLKEAVAVLQREKEPFNQKVTWSPMENFLPDLDGVKGQEQAKRALEISAAGNHNLLLIGPPGSGKTMLAQRFPGILPPITFEEALEISKIQSIAGLFQSKEGIAKRRPFRAPHSSTSYAGMVGGGNPVRPGELSLAHRGVLFMDEFPEFHRNALEALRQPFEEKVIAVSRVSGSLVYPADFLFVGAMNPCPCGFYGDPYRDCMCRPSERLQYRKRISGPLLDRIDLQVEVSRIPQEKLYSQSQSENSAAVKKRVLSARKMQEERYGSNITNGGMESSLLEKNTRLSADVIDLLEKTYDQFHFSTRGYGKILKISRTIADLDGSQEIRIMHVAEALQYRILDRNLLF